MTVITINQRTVPRIGLGGWAIGGAFTLDGRSDGWGHVDDAESERALNLGFDLGCRLFDTADVYGAGHSERVLGKALKARRADVLIATKFGYGYDEATKAVAGVFADADYMVSACDASLKRLGTDYIDLYQLHVGDLPADKAEIVAETAEKLVAAGKIVSWGWSTDDAVAAARMRQYPHFFGVQAEINTFHDAPEMIAFCDREGLAGLVRSPLSMGLLTGKFSIDSRLPTDDVRGAGHVWTRFFADGRVDPAALKRLDAIRSLLQAGGRSLAQGALGWLLARSPNLVPIPGFKTESQVRDNLGALALGPLPQPVMAEIDSVLAGESV